MRSPQFLEGMRQWMENAVTFRKMTNDFMAKVRNELQAPSRDDIDTVMLNIRHMEKRILDRMDEMCVEVKALNQRLAGGKTARPAAGRAGAGKRPSPKTAIKPGTGTGTEKAEAA
jgi:hypothetical protein